MKVVIRRYGRLINSIEENCLEDWLRDNISPKPGGMYGTTPKEKILDRAIELGYTFDEK